MSALEAWINEGASTSADPLTAWINAPPEKPSRSTGESVVRAVAMPAAGLNEGLARAAGALPDLVGAGLSAVGVPGIKPGYFTDAARSGLQAITGAPPAPETSTEQALYGAGRGAAEVAGTMIPGAAMARGGQVVQRVGQALVAQPGAQAVAGAVGGAVSETTGSDLAGLAASLATPVAAATGARLLQPVRQGLNPEMQRLAAQAAAEGIPLTAAQQTGSKPLRIMESVFDSLPLTAGPQAELRDAQQTAFNRAVLGRAGAAGDRATPAVVQANRDRVGAEFDRLSQNATIGLDHQFMNDAQDVIARYGRKLPSQQHPVVQAYLDDIFDQGAALPGATYQTTRSDLSRHARSARNNDPVLADALRGIRDALDNAAGRSIAPQDQAAWQQARTDWRYQRQIENAMAGAGQGAATGDVPAVQLRSAAVAGDRSGYARGAGELNDLSRIGQAFLRPPPDSGTSGRTAMTNLMQLGGTGAAGVAGGIPGLVGALAGPRLTQMVVNSGPGQRYLTAGMPGAAYVNQLAPQLNPALFADILGAQFATQEAPRNALLPSSR